MGRMGLASLKGLFHYHYAGSQPLLFNHNRSACSPFT